MNLFCDDSDDPRNYPDYDSGDDPRNYPDYDPGDDPRNYPDYDPALENTGSSSKSCYSVSCSSGSSNSSRSSISKKSKRTRPPNKKFPMKTFLSAVSFFLVLFCLPIIGITHLAFFTGDNESCLSA
jgi:hypothetical protein